MQQRFRRPTTRTAEAKRRSGPKQSRTDRRERFERRALERKNPESSVEKRFGIKLQASVDKALARLAIPHHSVDYRDPYAREERIELVLLKDDRSTAIAEVQFTLRRGIRGKIQDFLRAAIVRPFRDVPRFYLEIEDHIGLNLKPLAERIAFAIRDLLNEIRIWTERAEPGNAIGVALVFDRHTPTKFFTLRLARQLGSRARKMLEDLLAPVVVNEPEPMPAKPATKSVAVQRVQPQNHGPVQRVVSWLQKHGGFTPHPPPAHGMSQTRHPLRMPFRR